MSLLKNISDAAKARFPEIPFPHKKDEHWRFADLKAWGVDALFPYFSGKVGGGARCEKLRELEKTLHAPHSASLFDGQLVFSDLPEGVEILTMADAARERPELVEKFHSLAVGKFDVLQSSRAEAGVLVRVKNGADVSLDFSFVSKLPLSCAGAIFEIGEGARLSLGRTSLAFSGSFSVLRSLYVVGSGAELEMSSLKLSELSAHSYEREDFLLSDSARIVDALAQAGLSPSRHEKNYEISGGGVDVDTRAFLKISSDNTHDLRTRQMHLAPNSKSDLAVKAAVADSASLAFSGLIRVEPEAQKTKAYQSCRSLLLSPKARSQASPILEICANDVECSHGCAVSRPDAEELFYMAQRGLDPDMSLSLLVRSFAETTFEKISDRARAEKILGILF